MLKGNMQMQSPYNEYARIRVEIESIIMEAILTAINLRMLLLFRAEYEG